MLFIRKQLDDNNLFFDEDLRLGEDLFYLSTANMRHVCGSILYVA